MGFDRRKFMKLTGLSVLGAAAAAPARLLGMEEDSLLAPGKALEPNPGGSLTGRRWAMVVDIRKCREQENCSDCSLACHTVHNVPHYDSPKDEIKWIWKETFHATFHDAEHEFLDAELKHSDVPVLCNHCENPPCVRVCPTQATWKRESDGIVMMDMHRCIGCRYCIVACPYGSRSFNWRDPRPHIKEVNPDFPTRMRGVVEKCNFCAERLSRGQIPACVEACKHGALSFGDIEDSDSRVRALLKENFSIRRRPELGTGPEVYYLV